MRWLLNKLKPRSREEIAIDQLCSIRMGPSDIAIDCGANVGRITAYLSRSGAMVYAFEPNPFAFKVLASRFADCPNVRCIPKGVLDRNAKQKLYLHEFSGKDQVYWSTGSSILDYKSNVLKNQFVDVELVDLTEFIASLKTRIRLLKMDVEGVECRILKKLILTGLINVIDHVFVETHDRTIPELKPDTDEIRNLIQNNNLAHVRLDWI